MGTKQQQQLSADPRINWIQKMIQLQMIGVGGSGTGNIEDSLQEDEENRRFTEGTESSIKNFLDSINKSLLIMGYNNQVIATIYTSVSIYFLLPKIKEHGGPPSYI